MSACDLGCDTFEIETTGFRDANGHIIPPLDGRSAWSRPTRLDIFLAKASSVQKILDDWEILKECYVRCKNSGSNKDDSSNFIKDILKEVITDGTRKQFEAHQGQQCLLVLGNCPQYNVCMPVFNASNIAVSNTPTAFTIQVLKAVAQEFGPTISLDVRKAYRKYPRDNNLFDYSPCRAIDQRELRRLLWATKLEMAVAETKYKITWRSCFAFSTYPCRIADFLGIKSIAKTTFHIADCTQPEIFMYRKWDLVRMILKDITRELSGLNSCRASHEELYNKLARAMKNANSSLQIPKFNKAGDSGPYEKTLADIIAQQQELYPKVTLGSPPVQADLLEPSKCEHRIAKLKSVFRKSNNPQHLNEPPKRTANVELTAENSPLPDEIIRFIRSIQPSAESTAIQNKSKRHGPLPANPDSSSSNTHNKRVRKSGTSNDRAVGFIQPPDPNVLAQNRPQIQRSISSRPLPSHPDTRPFKVRIEVIVNSDKRHGETAFSTQPSRPNAPTHNQAQKRASNSPLPMRPDPRPLTMQNTTMRQMATSDSRTAMPESTTAKLPIQNESTARIKWNSEKIRPTEERYKWLFKSVVKLDNANQQGLKGGWRLPQIPPSQSQEYKQLLHGKPTSRSSSGLDWNLQLLDRPSKDTDTAHSRALGFLLDNPNPQVAARYHGSETLLHLTASCGERLGAERLMKKLLEWAPNLGLDYVNARNMFGMTPLHYAAASRSTAATRLLLQHGAGVSLIDHHKETALHRAASQYQKEQVRLLLDCGADANAADHRGMIAYDLLYLHHKQGSSMEQVMISEMLWERMTTKLRDGEDRGGKPRSNPGEIRAMVEEKLREKVKKK